LLQTSLFFNRQTNFLPIIQLIIAIVDIDTSIEVFADPVFAKSPKAEIQFLLLDSFRFEQKKLKKVSMREVKRKEKRL
jgi:hypothetical protein